MEQSFYRCMGTLERQEGPLSDAMCYDKRMILNTKEDVSDGEG